MTRRSPRLWFKFLVPSLVGSVAFLTPVRSEGVITIPMAVLSGWLTKALDTEMPALILLIVTISAVLSLWFSVGSTNDGDDLRPIRRIFIVSRGWLFLRLAGFVIAVLIFFQIGPEFIWSENTGHIVLYDLARAIVTIFIFASFLLPLLTEYGLMELIGTLFSRVFQKAFLLPGRSCIDALASWMAAAPVGVLITSQQYDSGNYSGREAATIATNFSVVSLPFCVIVAEFSGMAHVFVEYYLTVVVAGLVAALITPRVPPLSRIPNEYAAAGRQLHENDVGEEGLWRAGMSAALKKAETAPGPRQLLNNALHNLFDIWFGLMPPLIAIGTLGLVVAEYTPVFQILSYPLVPILELVRLPEASAAAPALLVGFTDMFLPAVLAKGIDSELTRFVVITVSVTQLIYMTEVGILILKTAIPLTFVNLLQVFFLRTAISLPIAIAAGHMIIA
jgi:nucleoside recognition membrane protein YjiH